MSKKITVIADPKADVDDLAAIYQLAIDPSVELHLVLGANKEVSREASEAYLKIKQLASHAESQGKPFKIASIMGFEDFLSEPHVCDLLLNISPWSVLELESFRPELKAVAKAGCPDVVVNNMVIHQGTFWGEGRRGFNSIGNDAFLIRMHEQNKLIELNSSLCAGDNGLMASADYLKQLPKFVSELLLVNSFTQLVSRAPTGISNEHFSVLGLVDPALGRGANYLNAQKYYEMFLQDKNAGVPFDEILSSDTAIDLATDYVGRALQDIKDKNLHMHRLDEAQKANTIKKLAGINNVIEQAFGTDIFSNGTIIGLSPSPAAIKATGHQPLIVACETFKSTPIVYTPLYDLQAWLLLNRYRELAKIMDSDVATKKALTSMEPGESRSEMMNEVVLHLISIPTRLTSTKGLGLFDNSTMSRQDPQAAAKVDDEVELPSSSSVATLSSSEKSQHSL